MTLMLAHATPPPRWMSVAVAAAALLAAGASNSQAADAARPSGGAATSQSSVPFVPRKTREELLREWDINSDGKIDFGEAEMAASRMRLKRADMRLKSGFDPVTGRPRGEPAPIEEPLEDEPVKSNLAAELEAANTPPKRPPAPPTTSGTRQPGSNAARFPAARPLPVTGGVRAGAQAARPGYGAETPASLNAGRPTSAPRLRGSTRAADAAADRRPQGGLLPRPPLQPPRSRDLYDPY